MCGARRRHAYPAPLSMQPPAGPAPLPPSFAAAHFSALPCVRRETEDPDKVDDDSDSFQLAFPKSNSWPERLQMLEGQQSVRTHGQLGFGLGGTVAGLMACVSVVEMAALNPHRRPPSPLLEAIAEATTETTTDATTAAGAEAETQAPAEAEAEAASESDGGLWKWW